MNPVENPLITLSRANFIHAAVLVSCTSPALRRARRAQGLRLPALGLPFSIVRSVGMDLNDSKSAEL